MKLTPVSNDPNAVVVDEAVVTVVTVEIVEGIAGTGAVLVEVAELQGVVVVKMVLLWPTSMIKRPSLPCHK